MRAFICVLLFLTACLKLSAGDKDKPCILVLGTAQDGGYPHMGCKKKCCTLAWNKKVNSAYVVSFALVDPAVKKWWLFEATPDIKSQLQFFNDVTKSEYNYLPAGIFITHAHIGHYTGLMQLGREVDECQKYPCICAA